MTGLEAAEAREKNAIYTRRRLEREAQIAQAAAEGPEEDWQQDEDKGMEDREVVMLEIGGNAADLVVLSSDGRSKHSA